MPPSYPRDLASHVTSMLTTRRISCPPLAVTAELLEGLYFTSLKREEGETVSCRVAFVERGNRDPHPPANILPGRWQSFALEKDLPFTVRNLAKLSKAVDPWSSTLAVDSDSSGKLRIWGLVDQSVHHSTFVVQETDVGPDMPGIFQAVIEGAGEIAVFRRYAFLGLLRHDVLITKEMGVLQSGPIRGKLLPAIQRFQQRIKSDVGPALYESRAHWETSLADEWTSTLSRILIGIQRYGHGGAVLLSDRGDGLSPRYSMNYPRLSRALDLAGSLQVKATGTLDVVHEEYMTPDPVSGKLPIDLYLKNSVLFADVQETRHEITGCIRFISSLSRIDGLLWLEHDLSLRGFGVIIKTEDDPAQIFRADDTAGKDLVEIDANNLGTRHRSMIRQCARDTESVGFVVSQDGDVRAIASVAGKTVMWENIRLQRYLNVKAVKAVKV